MIGLPPVRIGSTLAMIASFKPCGEQESLAPLRAEFHRFSSGRGPAFLQFRNPLSEQVSAAPGSPQALHHLLPLGSGSSGRKGMKQPPSIMAGRVSTQSGSFSVRQSSPVQRETRPCDPRCSLFMLPRPGPRAPEYSLAHYSSVSEGCSGEIHT